MKKKYFIVALGFISISIANFMFGNKTPEESSDLTLQNIEAMGLSASETICDGTNDKECTIYNDGMVVGKSTGPLKNYN